MFPDGQDYWLMEGDCVERMNEIPDGSVDAIICDPPYPEIDRDYGRMSEADWHEMMRKVVIESRRILTPEGSAVFILQPNYETPGRMRLWLWEFLVWAGREWGLVQDVYWWNLAAMPTQGCQRTIGLMRSSVKMCLWFGSPDCYRDQSSVLWSESASNMAARASGRIKNEIVKIRSNSKKSDNRNTLMNTCVDRGGSTPFNLLPIRGGGHRNPCQGHGAATSNDVADWWIRYISKPGEVVCDPFMGSGTIPIAALMRKRRAIGIEKMPKYFALSERRIKEPHKHIPRPKGSKGSEVAEGFLF